MAPASSLIQRLGRCNRDQKGRNLDEHGQVYIYRPPVELPYKTDVFDTGKELLSKLNLDIPITQAVLALALENITPIKERTHACKFTTPTWMSYYENDFRESDEYTVSAILESSIKDFKKLEKNKENVTGIILQAPIGYTEKEKERRHMASYCAKSHGTS